LIAYPGVDQTLTIYSADKYVVLYSDLFDDLGTETIVMVEDAQNGAKGIGVNKKWGDRNDYGVVYMDFIGTSFAAGSPLRKMQYDYLKLNGTLTNPEGIAAKLTKLFWSCH